jgi:hypothetical protein
VSDIVVRGNASAEELAVIIATLAGGRQREAAANPYQTWRARRLAAVRAQLSTR